MSKIIIIGGGVSGLSAGIFALKSGFEVSVYEKHGVIGGNLTGWHRGEYYIDNCMHWLTGTNPNTQTYRDWEEVGMLGDGIEVEYPDRLYTYSFGDKTLSLYSDLNRLKREMLSISPLDEREINSFISAVETAKGVSGIYGENSDLKFGLFKTLLKVPSLYRYHSISTKELSERFISPFLRKFFACFLGDNFSALAVILVFATFTGKNGGVPKGGSLAAAKRMEEKFKSLGGEVVLNKEAIKVVGGKRPTVTFKDGEVFECDYVVITGDTKSIFKKVIDAKMPSRLENMYSDKYMKRFSSVHTAFSVEGEVPFKGDYIIDVKGSYRNIINYPYLILKEYSNEKTFAPYGKTVITAMAFTGDKKSAEYIASYSDKPLYKSIKREIARTMEEIICEKFPPLFGKTNCIDVWTPATYNRYTNSEIGSYMSFVLPPKYIPFKISNEVKGHKNVIIASQWLLPPGGLPNALAVGKRATKTIEALEKFKKREFVYGKLKLTR